MLSSETEKITQKGTYHDRQKNKDKMRTHNLVAAVLISLLVFSLASFGQGQAPIITAVTNAAVPEINIGFDRQKNVTLAPRSMASIFGGYLATTTASATSPWANTLGGVEVHLSEIWAGTLSGFRNGTLTGFPFSEFLPRKMFWKMRQMVPSPKTRSRKSFAQSHYLYCRFY